MTTELDTVFVPLADELLDSFGTLATFKVVTSGGVYTPGSSSATTEVTSDVAWKIVPPWVYPAYLIDGDLIRAGDMQTLIAAQGITFTPLVKQVAVFASVSWRIISVEPIRSGDSVCSYMLQLRRGP